MNISFANIQLTQKQWPSIQRLAKKGDTQSMYLMGVAYFLGGLVDIDMTRAYFWFKKAAEKGHPDANFRCGFMLMHEKIVDDSITAKTWFERGAEVRSAASICALGNFWTLEKLKHQKWWHRWFSRKDASSGAIQAYGYYCDAFDLKYESAAYFKGLHELKGWGRTRSLTDARESFKSGMDEFKDRDCTYMLALTYGRMDLEYGIYLEKAADLGHPQAQYQLALKLLTYRDKSSTTQALNWLKRASMQRFGPAILMLSQTYYYGRGVDPDMHQAYVWGRRASSLGLTNNVWLNKIYQKLTDVEKYALEQTLETDDKEYFRLSNELFGNAIMPFKPQ